MTEGFLQIVGALVLLYAIELVSYVPPPRRLLVQAWFGRRARLEASELVLRTPWPWSLCFAVEGFRLTFGSRGIYVYQPHRITTSRPASWGHRWVTWDAIETVRAVGNELAINGRLLLKHSSDVSARQSRDWIERVRRSPAREREIEGVMTEMLSGAAIRDAIAATRRDVLAARVVGSALLLHIAATVVLFAATEWALPEWRRFLSLLVLLLGASIWQLVRGHRQLYPALRGDRWLKAVITAVNYPAACRVAEQLARDRLDRFHAVAVAQVLASPARARTVARRALLELRYPSPLLAEENREEIEAALTEHRARADRLLCAMLGDAGVDVEELVRPPRPADEGSYGYCPRCHEEYVEPVGQCEDCQVAVTRFSS